MRILLLYKYTNHYHLLADMMDDMHCRGLDIAALDIVYLRYHGKYLPYKQLFNSISILLRIPKFRGLFLRLFRNFLVGLLSKNFDVIDIHSFSSEYESLIKKLKKFDRRIVVTYWGSDLLRATDEELAKQRRLFQDVSLLRTTSPAAFQKVDSMDLSLPKSMCRFGVGNLEKIKAISKKSKTEWIKQLSFLSKDVEKKVLVVLGNNGSKAQQHLRVIDQLADLQYDLSHLLFIIPASYGFDSEYKREVEKALQLVSADFYVVENFLTRDELNSLILLTDIFITAQETDAFSAYVQEHLAAGTVVMAGDWLPYFILRNENIYLEDFDFSNLQKKFIEILENLKEKREKALSINAKMFEISSWKSLGQDWYNSYNKVQISS